MIVGLGPLVPTKFNWSGVGVGVPCRIVDCDDDGGDWWEMGTVVVDLGLGRDGVGGAGRAMVGRSLVG